MDESYCKYVKYRNLFNKLKRQSKFQYYSELLNKYMDYICKTWKGINSINGSKIYKSSISDTIIVNGISEIKHVKIANVFCKYFTEIGKTLANNISSGPEHFFSHNMSNINLNSIYFNPTDQNEILNILDQIKVKSFDHDKLNTHFLRQIKFKISAPPSHSDELID